MARAASAISASPPPSHRRPTAPKVMTSSRWIGAAFSASLAAMRGVGGGMHLERVERLPLGDHVAVAHAVDERGVVTVDAGDGLLRQDARACRRSFSLDAEALEHGVAGVAHLALIEAVHLEQAVGALDDLHAGDDARLLERRVGDAC